MKGDPGWMKLAKISTREHYSAGYREIGFNVDIHIEEIELIAPKLIYYWKPCKHKPVSVLIWGWFAEKKNICTYPGNFCMDKHGPQLPNVTYHQACWSLHQNFNFTSKRGYEEIRAALIKINSVITLNAIYATYNTWPEEIRKALPEKFLNVTSDAPMLIKPDRVVPRVATLWHRCRLEAK